MADSDMANEAAQGIEAAEAAREERTEPVDPSAEAPAPEEEGREATAEEKKRARAKRTPKSERTYTKARLMEESYDFTGHEAHLLAGALADRDDDDEMTVAEAKAAVTEWLKREV